MNWIQKVEWNWINVPLFEHVIEKISLWRRVNSSLTNIITIPNSVTKITNNAFEEFSSLTNITIPNSITKIDDCSFSMCFLCIIPNCVNYISKRTFPPNCKIVKIFINIFNKHEINKNYSCFYIFNQRK